MPHIKIIQVQADPKWSWVWILHQTRLTDTIYRFNPLTAYTRLSLKGSSGEYAGIVQGEKDYLGVFCIFYLCLTVLPLACVPLSMYTKFIKQLYYFIHKKTVLEVKKII